jgi:hypothetical protein
VGERDIDAGQSSSSCDTRVSGAGFVAHSEAARLEPAELRAWLRRSEPERVSVWTDAPPSGRLTYVEILTMNYFTSVTGIGER